MSNLADMIQSLAPFVHNGCLSQIQFNVIVARAHGFTYDALMQTFGLGCHNTVSKAIFRTCNGRRWIPGQKAGNLPFLGEVDQYLFTQYVSNEADEFMCVPTCVAIAFATNLRENRNKFARRLLYHLGCHNLTNKIEIPSVPSSSWIRGFCIKLKIGVVNAQELSFLRRIACDVDAIFHFFAINYGMLDRNPCLIYNMDETMVSAKKKYKVLVQGNRLPLVATPQSLPHVTACVTICAAGFSLPTMLILKNKKSLKNLEKYRTLCYFSSSSSGWINKRLFRYWSILFITEVNLYRIKLPSELRNKRFLLLLDGHRSRLSFKTILLFFIFMIDVILIPGHSTHVLQPFDVGIGSPLKVAYKKSFLQKQFSGNQANHKIVANELMCMMIDSLLDAVSAGCTFTNIKSAFAAAGISPVEPGIPLNNEYVSIPNQQNPTHNPYGGQLLTSPEVMQTLFRNDYGREMTEDDLRLDLNGLKQIVKDLFDNKLDGWGLSPIPPLHILDQAIINGQTQTNIRVFEL